MERRVLGEDYPPKIGPDLPDRPRRGSMPLSRPYDTHHDNYRPSIYSPDPFSILQLPQVRYYNADPATLAQRLVPRDCHGSWHLRNIYDFGNVSAPERRWQHERARFRDRDGAANKCDGSHGAG